MPTIASSAPRSLSRAFERLSRRRRTREGGRMGRTRTLKAALTILTLAAALALTSATMAYTTWGRWGTLNVSFYVNPANLDVSPAAALAALQAGMTAWNTQSGTAFRFNYAGQVGTTTAGSDGR